MSLYQFDTASLHPDARDPPTPLADQSTSAAWLRQASPSDPNAHRSGVDRMESDLAEQNILRRDNSCDSNVDNDVTANPFQNYEIVPYEKFDNDVIAYVFNGGKSDVIYDDDYDVALRRRLAEALLQSDLEQGLARDYSDSSEDSDGDSEEGEAGGKRTPAGGAGGPFDELDYRALTPIKEECENESSDSSCDEGGSEDDTLCNESLDHSEVDRVREGIDDHCERDLLSRGANSATSAHDDVIITSSQTLSKNDTKDLTVTRHLIPSMDVRNNELSSTNVLVEDRDPHNAESTDRLPGIEPHNDASVSDFVFNLSPIDRCRVDKCLTAGDVGYNIVPTSVNKRELRESAKNSEDPIVPIVSADRSELQCDKSIEPLTNATAFNDSTTCDRSLSATRDCDDPEQSSLCALKPCPASSLSRSSGGDSVGDRCAVISAGNRPGAERAAPYNAIECVDIAVKNTEESFSLALSKPKKFKSDKYVRHVMSEDISDVMQRAEDLTDVMQSAEDISDIMQRAPSALVDVETERWKPNQTLEPFLGNKSDESDEEFLTPNSHSPEDSRELEHLQLDADVTAPVRETTGLDSRLQSNAETVNVESSGNKLNVSLSLSKQNEGSGSFDTSSVHRVPPHLNAGDTNPDKTSRDDVTSFKDISTNHSTYSTFKDDNVSTNHIQYSTKPSSSPEPLHPKFDSSVQTDDARSRHHEQFAKLKHWASVVEEAGSTLKVTSRPRRAMSQDRAPRPADTFTHPTYTSIEQLTEFIKEAIDNSFQSLKPKSSTYSAQYEKEARRRLIESDDRQQFSTSLKASGGMINFTEDQTRDISSTDAPPSAALKPVGAWESKSMTENVISSEYLSSELLSKSESSSALESEIQSDTALCDLHLAVTDGERKETSQHTETAEASDSVSNVVAQTDLSEILKESKPEPEQISDTAILDDKLFLSSDRPTSENDFRTVTCVVSTMQASTTQSEPKTSGEMSNYKENVAEAPFTSVLSESTNFVKPQMKDGKIENVDLIELSPDLTAETAQASDKLNLCEAVNLRLNLSEDLLLSVSHTNMVPSPVPLNREPGVLLRNDNRGTEALTETTSITAALLESASEQPDGPTATATSELKPDGAILAKTNNEHSGQQVIAAQSAVAAAAIESSALAPQVRPPYPVSTDRPLSSFSMVERARLRAAAGQANYPVVGGGVTSKSCSDLLGVFGRQQPIGMGALSVTKDFSLRSSVSGSVSKSAATDAEPSASGKELKTADTIQDSNVNKPPGVEPMSTQITSLLQDTNAEHLVSKPTDTTPQIEDKTRIKAIDITRTSKGASPILQRKLPPLSIVEIKDGDVNPPPMDQLTSLKMSSDDATKLRYDVTTKKNAESDEVTKETPLSNIEKLKLKLASARPKAPPSSYVESAWNGTEVLARARSRERSLNDLGNRQLYSDRGETWRGGHIKESLTHVVRSGPSAEDSRGRALSTDRLYVSDSLKSQSSRTSLPGEDDVAVNDHQAVRAGVVLRGMDEEFKTKSLSDLAPSLEIGSAYRSYQFDDLDNGSSMTSPPQDDLTPEVLSPSDFDRKSLLSDNELRAHDSLKNVLIPKGLHYSLSDDKARDPVEPRNTRNVENTQPAAFSTFTPQESTSLKATLDKSSFSSVKTEFETKTENDDKGAADLPFHTRPQSPYRPIEIVPFSAIMDQTARAAGDEKTKDSIKPVASSAVEAKTNRSDVVSLHLISPRATDLQETHLVKGPTTAITQTASLLLQESSPQSKKVSTITMQLSAYSQVEAVEFKPVQQQPTTQRQLTSPSAVTSSRPTQSLPTYNEAITSLRKSPQQMTSPLPMQHLPTPNDSATHRLAAPQQKHQPSVADDVASWQQSIAQPVYRDIVYPPTIDATSETMEKSLSASQKLKKRVRSERSHRSKDPSVESLDCRSYQGEMEGVRVPLEALQPVELLPTKKVLRKKSHRAKSEELLVQNSKYSVYEANSPAAQIPISLENEISSLPLTDDLVGVDGGSAMAGYGSAVIRKSKVKSTPLEIATTPDQTGLQEEEFRFKQIAYIEHADVASDINAVQRDDTLAPSRFGIIRTEEEGLKPKKKKRSKSYSRDPSSCETLHRDEIDAIPQDAHMFHDVPVAVVLETVKKTKKPKGRSHSSVGPMDDFNIGLEKQILKAANSDVVASDVTPHRPRRHTKSVKVDPGKTAGGCVMEDGVPKFTSSTTLICQTSRPNATQKHKARDHEGVDSILYSPGESEQTKSPDGALPDPVQTLYDHNQSSLAQRMTVRKIHRLRTETALNAALPRELSLPIQAVESAHSASIPNGLVRECSTLLGPQENLVSSRTPKVKKTRAKSYTAVESDACLTAPSLIGSSSATLVDKPPKRKKDPGSTPGSLRHAPLTLDARAEFADNLVDGCDFSAAPRDAPGPTLTFKGVSRSRSPFAPSTSNREHSPYNKAYSTNPSQVEPSGGTAHSIVRTRKHVDDREIRESSSRRQRTNTSVEAKRTDAISMAVDERITRQNDRQSGRSSVHSREMLPFDVIVAELGLSAQV